MTCEYDDKLHDGHLLDLVADTVVDLDHLLPAFARMFREFKGRHGDAWRDVLAPRLGTVSMGLVRIHNLYVEAEGHPDACDEEDDEGGSP